MTSVRAAAIASVAFVVGAQPLVAQELSRYREYALESSVASVVKISGTRATDARTLQYQLVLISKTLDAGARATIKKALRLDTQEAPQRELDQRKKQVADAHGVSQKARVVNKAAFRP